MASLQETDLSFAWEKYMDCRLQGADLQVGAAGRHSEGRRQGDTGSAHGTFSGWWGCLLLISRTTRQWSWKINEDS